MGSGIVQVANGGTGASYLNGYVFCPGTAACSASKTIPFTALTGTPPAPFAAAGIPYATNTTASTVATSPQLVAALNTSPTTPLAAALLPAATSSSPGTVQPDNVSITVVGGVISAGTPITGSITIASPITMSLQSCTSVYNVTMSATVPPGRVVTISPAQGTTGVGEIVPRVVSVSGAVVSVYFCNMWSDTPTLPAGTYNLHVE